VAATCGVRPEPPRDAACLARKDERYDRLPADAQTIKAYVRAFAES
jgi:threonine synthase